jgi:hypothetical protein
VREAVERLGGIEVLHVDESELVLAATSGSGRLPTIFTALQTAGAEIGDTTLTRPTLESLFIKLTGKHLRE